MKNKLNLRLEKIPLRKKDMRDAIRLIGDLNIVFQEKLAKIRTKAVLEKDPQKIEELTKEAIALSKDYKSCTDLVESYINSNRSTTSISH